jgi:hypothetical protein
MSKVGAGGASGAGGVSVVGNVSSGIKLPRGFVYPSNISEMSVVGVCGVSVVSLGVWFEGVVSVEVEFVPSRASMILPTTSLTTSAIDGVEDAEEVDVSVPSFSDWISPELVLVDTGAGMTEASSVVVAVDVDVSSVLVAVLVATIGSVVVARVFISSVKMPVATSLPYEKILNICIDSPLFTPWRIILFPILISESDIFVK